jgi:hypothetical protein
LEGKLRKIVLFEGLGVDGKIILKMDYQEVGQGLECVDLFQDRGSWWVLLKAVTKCHVQ